MYKRPPLKTCTQCHKDKHVLHFKRSRKTKDGYTSICKVCMAMNSRNRRTREEIKRSRDRTGEFMAYIKKHYPLLYKSLLKDNKAWQIHTAEKRAQ